MLKTITPKSVTLRGARAATQSLASYLRSHDGRSENAHRLLVMSRYLAFGTSGHENRIVLHDHSDDILTDDTREWVREFVLVKEAFHQLAGIPYYHFIISPDPKDRVSAQECLDLAREWVTQCYPDAQWFSAIHDDNANHITHAHIVVNSVLPTTGRKIHRTKATIDREARVLQQLCEAHSLTPMMDLADRRRLMASLGDEAVHSHAMSAEAAERAIVARGGRSYKASVRAAVDETARASHSWQEFVMRLYDVGISVRRTRKGVTYVIDDWEGKGTRRVPSSSLGKAYTEDGVLDRLGVRYDSISGTRTAARGVPLRPVRKAYVLAAARVSYARVRPCARHRGPDGSVRYESLAELLVTRVSNNPRARELEDVITTLSVLQRGEYKTLTQLRTHMEDVAESVAETDLQVGELRTADSRLTRMLEIMVGMDKRKAELRRLESKRLWSPSEREQRKCLRNSIERDDAWLSDQLEEAYLWAETRGISSDEDPIALVAGMLQDTRREGISVQGVATRRREELERLVVANRVMTGLDGPQRPLVAGRVTATKIRTIGGMPMRKGMRLPDAQRARYSAKDWQGLAESIGEQIGDNRSIADAAALVFEDERRRREDNDAWLRGHGVDPATGRRVDLAEAGRRLQQDGQSGRARRSGEDTPQQ